MNLHFFIANKISYQARGTFSQTIHKVAITSIAVGILSLLLSFMILGGFYKVISEKIYSFGGQLLITKYTYSNSFENASFSMNDTLLKVLETEDYINNFQSFAFKAGLLKTKEEVQGVVFKGVDHQFDTTFFSSNIVRGRFPTFEPNGYTVEVLLSTKIANTLKVDIEDEVLIYFVQNPPRYRKLIVTGFYETGLEDFDNRFIIGDLNLVRRINDWEINQVGGVEVFISPKKKISESQSTLFNKVAADLYVESIEQKYLQLFDWLSLLNRNVYIFLTLILLVASFSMVSILLILIMERTNMIGILKSLGATNHMVRKIFFVSGGQLLIKGLFWGNSIGLGLALIQFYFKIIPLDQENYYMNSVPINFDFSIIIGVNFLTCLLIGLSFFIPISIINRIEPVQTVRFD
mgnify:CR=1 FL=1